MESEFPLYQYKEPLFSEDTSYYQEMPGGHYGVPGDPVPYNVNNDNVITSLLLVCFVFSVLAFSNARRFIIRQAKKFFYQPQENTTEILETSSELRSQTVLVFVSCLLASLLFYFYTLRYIGETFVLSSQYILIAIYLGISVLYILLKMGLYTFVNLVFFDSKRNQQWMKSLLFVISVEGLLLFPAVLLCVYFGIEIKKISFYVIIVLIFVKLLTIYKCYTIFFRRNVVCLQIILYFCSLEIIPLLAYWGVLVMTANNLKINF